MLKTISKNFFVTDYFENNHPSFLLIPFRPEDIFTNAKIARNPSSDLIKLMQERYPGKHVTITSGARKALSLALNSIRFNSSRMNVYIQTTSDNFYISSCVTNTIENRDNWSRESDAERDVVLVNHEFGYADNRLIHSSELVNIIEDCAFSFDSKFNNGMRVGSLASYSLLSFSKFFPIQLGGCLLSDIPLDSDEDPQLLKYIQNIVGHYFNMVPEWSGIRKDALGYYTDVFKSLGCTPVFHNSSYDVPGVFLFNLPIGVDKQKLKRYYWKRGVQCSAFYGREAFFLPLNQFTTREHIDFFADIFESFILNIRE